MRKRPIIALSGGFDPIHVGHVRMIQSAQAYGDVIVILNSDDWLRRKKGFVFMTWEQRCEILDAMSGVHLVMGVDDSDGTVCSALEQLRPDYFGQGGDSRAFDMPEASVCKELEIEMVDGLGGRSNVESSADLVATAVAEVFDGDV